MNITKNREHRQTGQRVHGDARERCEARNENGRWRSERSGRDTWKGAAAAQTQWLHLIASILQREFVPPLELRVIQASRLLIWS